MESTLHLRLPDELLDQIEEFRRQWPTKFPSKSEVVRLFIERGLRTSNDAAAAIERAPQ